MTMRETLTAGHAFHTKPATFLQNSAFLELRAALLDSLMYLMVFHYFLLL
ncbi:MAG: hypothetical protein Q8P88_01135 [Candidatus Jorgensenbacteria bacterium]|nr:hypothetical protein [Candidatus Jorgensenbacteria bacterium]